MDTPPIDQVYKSIAQVASTMAPSLSFLGTLIALPCPPVCGSDLLMQVDLRSNDDASEAMMLLQTRAGMVKINSSATYISQQFGDDAFPVNLSALAATLIGPMPSTEAEASASNTNLARTAKPTYIRDIGRKCGVCADENDLSIGVGNQKYDQAEPNTALEVCGPVCDKHGNCAGFNFDAELKRCYYRKDIACQGVPDTSRDCYTKVLSTSDSSLHMLDAAIEDEEVQVSALQRELGDKSRALLKALTEVSEVQGVLSEKIADVNGKIAERDLQTAANASLDQSGYAQVAAMKSSRAMGSFVRRVVELLGCSVKDEGGLYGFVPHYSGEIDMKTYAKLEGELKAVCKLPDTWLTDGSASALSATQ